MAMTPEGLVKKKVSELLTQHGSTIYQHMPVPGGFGGTTLDYVGCHMGRFFAIETKAPGKKPTPRQNVIIAMIQRAGGKAFVIDNVPSPGFTDLTLWLGDTP